MKQKIPLRHLTFLAICIALSLVSKRLISPITNVLTDFIRIPGGGAATSFSLMFLVIGTSAIPWTFAGTAAGFVQSLIALSLGMSSYQGFFALITYTVPGVIIDLIRKLLPRRDVSFFVIACGLANAAGALITNILVFRLRSIAFVLWMLIAALFGCGAGYLGSVISERIVKVPEYRRVSVCEKV